MSDEQMAEAILGRDAQEFCASDLGRYILGCADSEKAEAQAELAKVSAWRVFRVQELQNRIWRADSVKGWIAELILNGKNAERTMEHGTADAEV